VAYYDKERIAKTELRGRGVLLTRELLKFLLDNEDYSVSTIMTADGKPVTSIRLYNKDYYNTTHDKALCNEVYNVGDKYVLVIGEE